MGVSGNWVWAAEIASEAGQQQKISAVEGMRKLYRCLHDQAWIQASSSMRVLGAVLHLARWFFGGDHLRSSALLRIALRSTSGQPMWKGTDILAEIYQSSVEEIKERRKS